MENKKSKFGVMVAALLSLPAIQSKAEESNYQITQSQQESFLAFEDLDPETRLELSDKVNEITNSGYHIDWDKFALGLDENGDLVLRDKNQVIYDFVAIAKPSCDSPE